MALRTIFRSITENLSDYVNNTGKVKLYHYSNIDVDSFVANPSMFAKNSYTLGDAKHSIIPRVFFYLNKEQKERFFNVAKLYTTEVLVSQIYHLIDDPNGFKDKIREENNGALNFDSLLNMVKDAGYKGAYYAPTFDVVIWFYPIKLVREIE